MSAAWFQMKGTGGGGEERWRQRGRDSEGEKMGAVGRGIEGANVAKC